MDGARLAGDLDLITIGRHAGNDLPLPDDTSVSGRHSQLSRSADSGFWRLEDRDSCNGTWVDDVRLAAPHVVRPGTDFIAGSSVLRVSATAGRETFLPGRDLIRREIARLRERFSPATARAFGVALGLAIHGQGAYVSDRHLFPGLAMISPDLPCFARRGGALTNELIAGVLSHGRYWKSAASWIHTRMPSTVLRPGFLFEDELVLTPRLLQVLLAAEQEAAGGSIEPRDVLLAIFDLASSHAHEVLERQGVAPAELRARLAAEPRRAAAPAVATPAVATPAVAAIDLRASAADGGLNDPAALYHRAAPEERRRLLEQLLEREAAALPAAERRQLLERQLAALARLERPRVELVREVFRFADRAERFIVAVAHNFADQMSDGSEVPRLPGYQLSIFELVDALEAGEPIEIGELRGYLGAVGDWLISAVSAYQGSAKVWAEAFWSKLSPVAIEARLSQAGWKQRLGLDALELWGHYREAARTISPDLVSDEIFQIARQRAAGYYAQLKGERQDAR